MEEHDNEHENMVIAIKFFLLILAVCVVFASLKKAFGEAPSFEYCEVVKVVDGDTLDLRCPSDNYRVRLAGLNTPERGEKLHKKATDDLKELVSNKRVAFENIKKDRYGRSVGIVKVDSTCVNVAMRNKYKDTRYDKLVTGIMRKRLISEGWK